MSAKKLAATALLTFVLLSQASFAAFAEEDGGDDNSSSFTVPTARPLNPAPNERKHHSEKPSSKVGEDKAENFQVAVPPMVITPDLDDESGVLGSKTSGAGIGKQSFKVSPPKGGSGVAASVPDTAGKQQIIEPNSAVFDPTANAPIEMSNIHPNSKSPADVFIESAQIGIGAMAVGAAVLGITAGVRGSKSRRESKTDFIYEVEN
jgi:hypothetical protein